MDSLIIFCAKYLIGAVALLLGWAWLRSTRPGKIKFAIAAVVAGAIALFLAEIAGKIFYDPRPFVTRNLQPLVQHAPENGFPSGHTWISMTTTALLYYYGRSLFLVSLVITVAVGTARVLALVHSPIDIVGGIIIGSVAGYLGYRIAQILTNGQAAGDQSKDQT